MGTVTERKLNPAPPTPDHPFIIQIQDAHANPTAQKNIAKIIEHYKRHSGVEYVLVEASAAHLDATYLEWTKNPQLNQRMKEHLVRTGEMTGADIYLFEQGNKIRFSGIENADLYRKNLESLRAVYGENKNIESVLKTRRAELENQISRKGNGAFTKALHIVLQWDQQTDVSKSLSQLNELGKKQLGRDMRDAKEQRRFPSLMRLLRLKEEQNKINFEQAKREWEEIKRSSVVSRQSSENLLTTDDPRPTTFAELDEFFSGNDSQLNPRFALEQLYGALEAQDFHFRQYPAFTAYMKSRMDQSEIDAAGLAKEIETWLREMSSALAKSDDEKKLLRKVQEFRMLRKLLRLELTREEWGSHCQSDPERSEGEESSLHQTLGSAKRKHSLRLATQILRPAIGGPQNDNAINSAFHFYRLAEARDAAFIENIERIAREKKLSKIIVVTGGFHTLGLTRKYAVNQSSYIVVSPKVDTSTPPGRYQEIMSAGNSDTAERAQLGAVPEADLPEDGVALGWDMSARHQARMALANSLGAGPLRSGQTVVGDRFLLQDQMGFGGQAQVWSALDQANENQKVILKWVRRPVQFGGELEQSRTGYSSSGAAKSASDKWLEREAKYLKQLQHPNLVSIIDFHQAADGEFIVMQPVEGVTFDYWMAALFRNQRPDALEQAIKKLIPVANALRHAHHQKIIHRDIKPENIIIRASDEQPVLIDFGLAAETGKRPEDPEVASLVASLMTTLSLSEGAVGGTLPYMA
ncbi:MAG: protein kinase, partial [Candidatus Omnitrophica bacterium]|nr:protein kinase [Candidatus Omnitrophota bacterium]